ncbi:MAG: hypothetical protein V7L23_14550 [Nostoc sp.]|uniref:hypothetical protein n=1 Tax=Nostoc sp. TaxID=1180 RepID=UPI002FF12E03
MRFWSIPKKLKIFTFLFCSVAMYILATFSVNAQDRLTDQSKLFINGIGSVRVGMTVEEASISAGIKIINDGDIGSCSQLKLQGKPEGIEFLSTNGIIARVDVYKNKHITTVKGARLEDTEARIKSLYKGQIQVSHHSYVPGGHYLTFIPKDKKDRNYRIVFETDGKRVTWFRSGRLPEVEYIEGCA